jgi:hypothetical protein
MSLDVERRRLFAQGVFMFALRVFTLAVRAFTFAMGVFARRAGSFVRLFWRVARHSNRCSAIVHSGVVIHSSRPAGCFLSDPPPSVTA